MAEDYKNMRRKKRRPTIGDMDTFITIQNRAIVGPTSDAILFTEQFSTQVQLWALMESVSDVVIDSNTNQEVAVSHRFTIHHDVAVTTESWVELEGIKYDIISKEDLDGRGQYDTLFCNIRGTNTKQVNYA